VGNYALLTYSGSIINPGVIVNMSSLSGGVWSLDPAINYVGSEPIMNVYEELLEYNGSQTDSFVPVIADALPTHTPDFMNYAFHIRQGLTFTDGTPVTPYDVKYSFTRTMLFVSGSPPTPGWIVSQLLVPTNPDGSWNLSFANVNNAITIDNTSQTVTFHLVGPRPPILLYQVMALYLGSSIVSHTWLEQVGPKLVWSDAGFLDYQKYAFQPNWVQAWRYGTAGSGPYMVDYVSDPDAIVLKANPTFVPLPGVPAPSASKVVIQYVSDDSTRELSLESGKADIASIATSRFGSATRMQSGGLVHIMFAPTLTLYSWIFNMEIYAASVGPNSNPYNNHVPPDFFVDINMRKAFFYAFDFNQYLDQILGNAVYHATFGTAYNGVLPYGMPGYQNLSSMNVFDMAQARHYYTQTQWVKDHGWADSGFTLGLNVGDTDSVAKAAAAMWAQNLEQLAPPGRIQISVAPIFFSEVSANAVPHQNPMSIYSVGFQWGADYPFPTDYTVPLLLPGVTYNTPYGGYYPATNAVNIEYFASNKNGTNQVANLTKMYNWIVDELDERQHDADRPPVPTQQLRRVPHLAQRNGCGKEPDAGRNGALL
jgi:ABC-type transport system substrate-binding protein